MDIERNRAGFAFTYHSPCLDKVSDVDEGEIGEAEGAGFFVSWGELSLPQEELEFARLIFEITKSEFAVRANGAQTPGEGEGLTIVLGKVGDYYPIAHVFVRLSREGINAKSNQLF